MFLLRVSSDELANSVAFELKCPYIQHKKSSYGNETIKYKSCYSYPVLGKIVFEKKLKFGTEVPKANIFIYLKQVTAPCAHSQGFLHDKVNLPAPGLSRAIKDASVA